jgi:hypothetical protein
MRCSLACGANDEGTSKVGFGIRKLICRLATLTRYDFKMPARVARIYVNNLVHENIVVRKSAYHIIGCILKQQKRSHPKIEISTVDDSTAIPSVPGDREDNRFMCYDPETVPR